jgi:hypothetical protein
MILVGLGAMSLRDEFVARDAEHGLEDAGVGDTARSELGIDHVLT